MHISAANFLKRILSSKLDSTAYIFNIWHKRMGIINFAYAYVYQFAWDRLAQRYSTCDPLAFFYDPKTKPQLLNIKFKILRYPGVVW